MGLVTLAFDDGYLDTFKSVFPLLRNRNIKATFAVSPGFIERRLEGRDVLSLEEVSSLIKEGHEIASHTMHHVNMLEVYNSQGEEAVREELFSSREKLEEVTHTSIDSFVFPFIENNSNAFLREISSSYYSSSRITTESLLLNSLKVKDPFNLVGVAVTRDFPMERYEKIIEEASGKDAWFIEVFHLVSQKNTKSAHRDEPYRFFTHVEEFEKHLGFLTSMGIEIMTQGDVIKRYASI